MIGNAQPAEPRARLAWEVRTVADRFRHLSEARLTASFPPYESRAEAGRQLAQRMADAAAGIAGRSAAEPPRLREVPTISVFAVGEQVAVTGNDLVTELEAVADGDIVCYEGRPITVASLTTEIINALRDLRLTL